MVKKPTVSIGLPVFNREDYVKHAVESILAQTFSDFEFIIVDDASIDHTANICQEYALKDHRIRFFANEKNTGLRKNHNRVFELATGKYFHWMGGDDSHDPRFLERCVEAMETHPKHVLCHTQVRMIDENGDTLCVVDNALRGAGSTRAAERLAAIIFEDPFCHSMYGLFRSEALRRTELMGNFHRSDHVLVVQAVLQGPCLHIPEPLFFNRDHQERYSNRPELWRSAFGTTSKKDHVALPLWRAYIEWVRAVRRFVEEPRERRACYRELARWWLAGSNLADMTLDVITYISPGLAAGIRALKRKVLGARDPFGRAASRGLNQGGNYERD